jgi:8-oxo-dGTP diphosphatase
MSKNERTVQLGTYLYVDLVCLTIFDSRLHVLTVERKTAQDGKRAIPGGLLEETENLPDAAVRELQEETGLKVDIKSVHQIGAYGAPDRDTRYGRAVTVAYLALIPNPESPLAGSDARDSKFIPFDLTQKPGVMEFDHREIIRDARRLARRLIEDTPIATQFCGREFTMTELRSVYEAILGYEVDAANFRKKVEAVDGFVEQIDYLQSQPTGAGRPARLFHRGSVKELNPPIRFRPR